MDVGEDGWLGQVCKTQKMWINTDYFIFFLFLQTYIGSVVISMNPYRSLPIFTPEKVEEYRNRNFYELSPHMWVIQPLLSMHIVIKTA